MRRRWPWAVGLGVGAALLAGWGLLLVNPPEERVAGLAAADDRPFGDGTVLAGDILDARYSPDGRHLLIRTDEGLALAREGKLDDLGPRTPSIAAAAWYPNSNLVVIAEGPARTGQLAVLDLAGADAGVVKLDPEVGFGPGHGIAVLGRGRQAAAVTVDRDPLSGAEIRRLHLVDLASGRTTELLAPEAAPSGPIFDAGGDILLTQASGQRGLGCAYLLDPAERTGRCVTVGRAVGVARGHAYSVHRGELWTAPLAGGEDERLTGIVEDEDTVVVAVAPDGGSIVLRDSTGLRKRDIPDPPA